VRLNDSDAERVLAGQVPTDHADLTQVAAFLSTLPDTSPPAEVGSVRDDHLYAVTREARLLAAAPPPRTRRSTRRLVVAALAAGVGVLTMGVGVAAAVGANPLSFLPNLLPEPAISSRLGTPASLEPSTTSPSGRPVPTKPTTQPTPGGDSASAGQEGTPESAKTNNGKSDEAKSEHKPTPKPSHTNNGKSDEAKSEHKPTPKPTPSNNARTNPPGKTKSDAPKPEKPEKPGSKQTQAAR